jgi:hypothetical protein
MPGISRVRDVNVLFKGDSYTVMVDDALRASGWQGGQGVKWVDSDKEEFIVGPSDGLYGGFLLWGSNEPSDQYVSSIEKQVEYGYAVFCAGGWLMATRTFERYTYASRQAGPLVPITYTVGERVRFSLRGWWTNEDEWALSGDPRGSNGYFIGNVVQTPTPNDFGELFLTLQTSI